MCKALDPDKKQKFQNLVEWLWCVLELRNWLSNFMFKYVTRLVTTNMKSCDLLALFCNVPSSPPSPAKETLLSFFNTRHFWFAANQMWCSLSSPIKGIVLRALEFSSEKGKIDRKLTKFSHFIPNTTDSYWLKSFFKTKYSILDSVNQILRPLYLAMIFNPLRWVANDTHCEFSSPFLWGKERKMVWKTQDCVGSWHICF